MTNLDMLLLKGGTDGMTEENLAELRYTILAKGIPANSEGMVRPIPTRRLWQASYTTLYSCHGNNPGHGRRRQRTFKLIQHSPNCASTFG
jgi:hypothetical protein